MSRIASSFRSSEGVQLLRGSKGQRPNADRAELSNVKKKVARPEAVVGPSGTQLEPREAKTQQMRVILQYSKAEVNRAEFGKVGWEIVVALEGV